MKRLFGTDGIRGVANTYPLLPEVVLKLGIVLTKSIGIERPNIIVGRDTRYSGDLFESAITAGICAAGGTAILVGVLPTPAVAYLTKKMRANAGVMISASHNPACDNGIKIFGPDGYKIDDKKEEEIEYAMYNNTCSETREKDFLALSDLRGLSDKFLNKDVGRVIRTSAEREFIAFEKSCIRNKRLNKRIVLDCANGAAYFVAPIIFAQLGANVIVINDKPNGTNINKDCGVLNTKQLRKSVLEHGADLGIALDGDADRVIVVDEDGREFDGDDIMYICAKYLASRGQLKNNKVITTLMSNEGLAKALSAKGIALVRTNIGDRYVIEELRKSGCNFGGEQCGHIIFADHSTTGDGILCGLFLLDIMQSSGKKLSELVAGFEKFPQVLINIAVKEKKDFNEMPLVLRAIEEAKKALGSEGRVLVRYSGTEKIARVMVEAKEGYMAKELANDVAESIRQEIGL